MISTCSAMNGSIRLIHNYMEQHMKYPWKVMCSLYHLDTYNRDNILLKVYKGESRGGFTNLMCTPVDRVI
jgi:hypothetical protein